RRGRFRDFVRIAVLNLVNDYRRRLKMQPRPVSPDSPILDLGAEDSTVEPDADFVESWRREVTGRAWKALEQHQTNSGRPYYDVMRLRADHPNLTSSELAALLSIDQSRPFSDVWVRQMLHRGRAKLADLILDEVWASLDDPSREELEGELIVL